MKKETYVKCMDFIRSTPSGVVIVNNLGKLFTFITAACYLFITAGCIWGRLWQELIIYLAIPGISFVAVSIFRKCYNAKLCDRNNAFISLYVYRCFDLIYGLSVSGDPCDHGSSFSERCDCRWTDRYTLRCGCKYIILDLMI